MRLSRGTARERRRLQGATQEHQLGAQLAALVTRDAPLPADPLDRPALRRCSGRTSAHSSTPSTRPLPCLADGEQDRHHTGQPRPTGSKLNRQNGVSFQPAPTRGTPPRAAALARSRLSTSRRAGEPQQPQEPDESQQPRAPEQLQHGWRERRRQHHDRRIEQMLAQPERPLAGWRSVVWRPPRRSAGRPLAR